MYPELDFTKSFHKLKELFLAYNQVIKTQHPTLYKKLSLKSTQIETMKEILRFYGAHLFKSKRYALPEDRRFWITNTGIAKHKLQHRSTIYRHIVALQQAGIITNKIFHGSSCGIEVEIHPYLLVFKNTIEKSKQWIEQELLSLNQKSNDNNDLVATCEDTDSGYFLYNINKLGGNVENLTKSDSPETLGWKQGSKNRVKDMISGKAKNNGQQPETIALGRAGADQTLIPSINFYTDKAWLFAKQILYPDQIFANHQVTLSKKYISEYFSLISQKGFKSNVDRLYLDLCERILLARKYIDRSPARFIPVPWKWFDKNFSGGLKGTLDWLKKAKENRKRLKKQYLDLSELCSIYKSYFSELSLHSYKTCESHIKSMNDEELVKLYYGCVSDSRNFNPTYLHTYYRKN